MDPIQPIIVKKNGGKSLMVENKNSNIVTIPKKRGRKPKPKPKPDNMKEEPKLPQKRGRKPKPKPKPENMKEVIKIPQKRGRKPKPKSENMNEPKIPKKRGRKPKDKYNVVEKNDIVDITNEENVVLHLPINTNTINNNMSIQSDILRYTPVISNPTPYDPDNNMFSIEETEIQHKNKIEPNKLKLVIEYKDDNIENSTKSLPLLFGSNLFNKVPSSVTS